MRASRNLWALTLSAVLLGGCLAALAQEKMAGGEGDAQARVQRMAKELNLTEDQKEKLKPILTEQADAWRGVRDDTALTPAQKKVKMKEIHEKYAPQVNAILTPEQREKWQKMKEEAWEKHKEGAKGGEMEHEHQ